MPHSRRDWQQRIKSVELEYLAARRAADQLLATAQHDPTVLGDTLALRDIRHMADRLDGTYIIRLFAEYETSLRKFWPTARGTDPPARAKDLLDGVAATCRIPHDQRENAHTLREYRNSLVHERDEPTEPVPIQQARSHLTWYLKFLPPNW